MMFSTWWLNVSEVETLISGILFFKAPRTNDFPPLHPQVVNLLETKGFPTSEGHSHLLSTTPVFL